MERRHHRDATHLLPVPAKLANRRLGLKQRLHCEGAEANQHLALHEIDLTKQKRLARRDLVRFRIAVFGRPALDNIANIDLLTRESHATFDYIREQLTRSTDERLAAGIFIGAGSFADKHKLGVGVAYAEDQVRAKRGELATGTVAD